MTIYADIIQVQLVCISEKLPALTEKSLFQIIQLVQKWLDVLTWSLGREDPNQ